EEFAPYRTSLADLTKAGDTSPAHRIYGRFLHRLEQHVDYATELLKTAQFVFDGHDTYSAERRELPRPRDLTEARQLWQQRLRYEYLEEKLNNKKPAEITSI